MQTYELLVEGRTIRSNSTDNTLVKSSVGVDRVHVMFDSSEWLSFPVTVTFAQKGVTPITTPLTLSAIANSSEWSAEGTVVVPYEVITMVGPIRVTFQGTDSDGRHIITAAGFPLEVEEAGDIALGVIPGDAPTVDQWHQAYSNAQVAINEVRGIIENLQSSLDSMIAQAEAQIENEVSSASSTIVDTYAVPATATSLGLVMVGDGLHVTDDGMLSTVLTNGITSAQASQILNLASLAYYCFDTSFDEDGVLEEGAMVKGTAIPVDGTTLKVNEDGKIEVAVAFGDSEVY